MDKDQEQQINSQELPIESTENHSAVLGRRGVPAEAQSENIGISWEPSDSSASTSDSNLSTIGDGQAMTSDTSGYASDSSYYTAISNTTSYPSLAADPYVTETMRSLHEIHVGISASITEPQIDNIREDLRAVLSRQVAAINGFSGGGRDAIYVIAYNYM